MLIGIGFVLMHEDGLLPKLLAFFLFVSGIQISLAPQFFIVETSPGMLSITTPFGYPTAIITVLIWLHIVLSYWAIAKMFAAFGRDPVGRKQS